jgi:hypothetical protein
MLLKILMKNDEGGIEAFSFLPALAEISMDNIFIKRCCLGKHMSFLKICRFSGACRFWKLCF